MIARYKLVDLLRRAARDVLKHCADDTGLTMRTDELIAMLARGTDIVDFDVPQRRLATALGGGAFGTTLLAMWLIAAVALLGPRLLRW